MDDIVTPRLRLCLMSDAFLEASLNGEIARAEALLEAKIPAEWFQKRDHMMMRLGDRRRDPAYFPWSVRAMVARPAGEGSADVAVGYTGFHSRPDPEYLKPFTPRGVELGYTVFSEYRRQGFAEEAVRGMLRWAAERDGVAHFVVSIAPSNVASNALAAKLGFVKVGTHQDPIDGLEDVFVLPGEALSRLVG